MVHFKLSFQFLIHDIRYPASLVVADRKSQDRSSRAVIVALFMEFVSRNLRRTPSPSAALERSEYARRDKDMVWYLLRGSIWESYTKFVPKLRNVNVLLILTPPIQAQT